MRKLPAADTKFVNSEDFADEVTNWLNDTADVDEFAYRVAYLGDILCNKCYSKLRLYRSNKKPKLDEQQLVENPLPQLSQLSHQSSSESCSQQSTSSDLSVGYIEPEPKEETVELPLKRTVSTHKYCCLCGLSDDLTLISFNARSEAFTKTNIFIPKGWYPTIFLFFHFIAKIINNLILLHVYR